MRYKIKEFILKDCYLFQNTKAEILAKADDFNRLLIDEYVFEFTAPWTKGTLTLITAADFKYLRGLESTSIYTVEEAVKIMQDSLYPDYIERREEWLRKF